MSHQYTCEACGGTYDSDRPNEEALDEAVEKFGAFEAGHVVCDDCYRAMGFSDEPRGQA